jgi:hypothetical protein
MQVVSAYMHTTRHDGIWVVAPEPPVRRGGNKAGRLCQGFAKQLVIMMPSSSDYWHKDHRT